MPVITVSQVNKYIGFILKNDKNMKGVMVKGEISNYVCNYRSGHVYFTLKDSESSLKAVMFASSASRLKFEPEDGMSVVVSGSIGVYEVGGVYQLYANDIIPAGAGAESVALEQLKKKLAKEGIFDQSHKRPLPVMPKKIGAVTSLSGAAVRDIINVLTRRYPIGEVYVVNAVVQGENAADSVCRGIFAAESAGCDVIIVGRGGGSAEDLSAFNSEKIAYAIYNCKVPVISAVGHETDFTIADLAADMRAPTPSAAAELSAPSVDSLYEKIDIIERRAFRAANAALERAVQRFGDLSAKAAAQSPENRLALSEQKLESLSNRSRIAFERYAERKEAELSGIISRLEGLSPLKVLSRGYSLVYKGDSLINSSENLSQGDHIRIQFGNGGAEAEIINKW